MFAPSRGRALARAAEAAARTATTTTRRAPAPSPFWLFGRPVGCCTEFAAAAAAAATATATAARPTTIRYFSATTAPRSRLGRMPIPIPQGVEFTIGDLKEKKDPTSYVRVMQRTVSVQGSLGKLDLIVPDFVNIDYETEARRVTLSIQDREQKRQREMWGTTWAHIHQYILGVSEGHTAVLRLVGIGYRATVEDRPEKEAYPGQKFVVLKLGFNHAVEMGVPQGVAASTPQPTRILLEGINLQDIMLFAASIRRWRKPEPYKGKGIFINEETIALKQKKVK